MKLYYAPGLCSLAPHIVLREADLPFALERVIYLEKMTASGEDYWAVNPKGQVPVLELPNGERLTECAVILQFIADQKPNAQLIPQHGTLARYRVQEWLNFIATDLHKAFIPIFRPSTPDEYKRISREAISNRFDWLNVQFQTRQHLAGEAFTVADSYLFTVLRWCTRADLDILRWPNLTRFVNETQARPTVGEALKAEGF